MTSKMVEELWVPPSAERRDFKKGPAPQTGNKFGVWAGRDLSYLNMPGGAVMMFDLSKLSLQDFRQMRDHYQVSASLNLLAFMMHQIDWRIEGDNSKINAFIEHEIREKWTQLIRGLAQSYWAGFSPLVLDWSNDAPGGRIGIERIKDLVPEDCWVRWKVEEGAPNPDWASTSSTTLVDGVMPRGAANSIPPRFYEYDGIIQASPGLRGNGVLTTNGGGWGIPPENTLWYPLLMENGDYYGRKLLKPAFAPWFFSMLIHLFSNRYYERFGEPLPIGRADFDDEVVDANGNYVTGKQAMETILRNIRNRAVVVLPSERVPVGTGDKSEYAYDIEYLESQMRGADFERYMTRLDEEISLSLFTPLLMLRTADVGSYNLGTTHVQAYLWMLNSLAGDIKYYIDNYIVDRLRTFNWGVNAPDAHFEYRSLGKDNAELLRTLVLETVRTGMARPDLDQLGQAVGMDFEEITALTQAPGAQVPGVIPGQGVPAKPGASPTPADNRTTRPERTAPRGVQKQIAARVQSQLERHRRSGHADFTPDIGFRRQVADFLDLEPHELEVQYASLTHWVKDIAATDLTVPEIMTYFEKVCDTTLRAA